MNGYLQTNLKVKMSKLVVKTDKIINNIFAKY